MNYKYHSRIKDYMRVRILQNHKGYKRNDVVEVSRNVAFGLIDSGKAELTKDLIQEDYKVKDILNEQNHNHDLNRRKSNKRSSI